MSYVTAVIHFVLFLLLVFGVATDLKRSTREAEDCPVFRLGHRAHVHVPAARRIDDVDDLWLPLSCDLKKQELRK